MSVVESTNVIPADLSAVNLDINAYEPRERFRAALIIAGVTEVVVEYSGYFDSGGVEQTTPEDLDPEIVDFLYTYVIDNHAGYENNEGGQGNITWKVWDDKILLEHGNNYISTDDSLLEF